MNFFENINLDALQPLQDVFPDGWFDDIRQLYGESLSDEMISQSVEDACDFFHIDEPAIVSEGWTTGVYPNNDFTLKDDVLVFNREQLLDMGISGKDGLDLVMTHEGTHRVLQGMEHLEFDSHQEELCCDYMAGVRAGLNDIDVSQMANSLMYTPETASHPAGVDKVESIESGIRFAQQYYAEYNMAPSFDDCIEHFCELNEIEHNSPITLHSNNFNGNIAFKGNTGNIYDQNTIKFLEECQRHNIDLPISVDHCNLKNESVVERSTSGGLKAIDKSIISDTLEIYNEDGKLSDKDYKYLLKMLNRC